MVGEASSVRASYADMRVYITIKMPVREDGFEGTRKAEGYIDAPDAVGVKILSDGFYSGSLVVLDKTGRVRETLWGYEN